MKLSFYLHKYHNYDRDRIQVKTRRVTKKLVTLLSFAYLKDSFIYLQIFGTQGSVRPWHLVQQHGKLLLSSNLPYGGGENHAENMGGSETDATLTTNSHPLGQLPDESLR